MAILGAHMSMAGGYYKAVLAAAEAGCDCVQLFTKNNNQWRARDIKDEEVDAFQSTLKEQSIQAPLSHASYLINLGSPDKELRKKSIEAFVVELQRADQLGIPFVVLHPGSYTTSSEEEGLKNIVKSLDAVHKSTSKLSSCCLLENTAGQGSNLGWKFEHLATIIDGVKDPERLGVCIDTCHAFAAGHPMGTEAEYKATIRAMNQTFGIKMIKAFHLNDSKKEFGSRKDRHEHIGQGEMGIEPFRFLLNDRRFKKVPMYLETPKGEFKGEDYDKINLRVLRELVG